MLRVAYRIYLNSCKNTKNGIHLPHDFEYQSQVSLPFYYLLEGRPFAISLYSYHIRPASGGFYHNPTTCNQLI